jgi:hypothetical protein
VSDPLNIPDDEILPEYSLKGGVRGKYAEWFAQGMSIVRLDADVAAVFGDSEPVNTALRALVAIVRDPEAKASD